MSETDNSECSNAANKAGKRIASQTTRKIKNKTCLICGNPLTGRQLKFCCHDCAAEGAKREPAKVNRTYRYGKLRKKVLMYADIRRHNAANPIACGWRGRPCGGGAHLQTRYPMSI